MPRLHLKLRTLIIIALAGAIAIGLGIWGWVAWRLAKPRPDVESVEVKNAMAWARPVVGMGARSAASEAEIALTTSSHRPPYADAEVIIESWTDDLGTDLLLPVLRTYYPCPGYEWRQAVFTGKKTSSHGPTARIVPPRNWPTPKAISWIVGSPVDVSPAATTMRVQGSVVFCEGEGSESVRIAARDVRPGQSFRLGQTECSLKHSGVDLRSDYPGYQLLVLWSSDCRTPLVAVRFVDDAGNDLQDSPLAPRSDESLKVRPRIDEPLRRSDEILCPPFADYAAMVIEYWPEARTRTIPFDVTLPVARQTRSAGEDPAMGSAQVTGPESSAALFKPVPEEAWGPRADDDPRELCEVVHEPGGVGSYVGVLGWRFVIKLKKPLIMSSYDVTITDVHDSQGDSLLCRAPARSAVTQYCELEVERYGHWRQPGDRLNDPEPWFNLKTNLWPSSKATSVEVEGVVRFKIADKLTTVELADVSPNEKTEYTVGSMPFRLCPQQNMALRICVEGDLGLIQGLTLLAQDGATLYATRRAAPYAFWSHSGCFGFALGEDKIKAIRRMQVQYYSNYRHYLLPFKVTVPSKEQD